MKKIAIAAVAAGTLFGAMSLAQAEDSSIGYLCSFASTNDPSEVVDQNPDRQYGEIDGGPFAAADLDVPEANPLDAAITCSLQVGGTGNASEADSVRETGDQNLPVAVLPPTPINYLSPSGVPVWLCTTWTVNGTNYYFNYAGGPIDPATGEPEGEFTTVESEAFCAEAISQETELPSIPPAP